VKQILQKFEKSYPELGDVLLTEQEIDQMERSGGSLNVIYVLTKVRCEINKKMYCLTQYLTRTYQDGRTDPVEQMRGVPVVALHHDRFLIQDTLKEIETIFQRAVLWNKETQDLKELTDDIGTMTYLFAHCMPFCRGSAAIGEWLQEAIYTSHGLEINSTGYDLKAISSPTLDEFMANAYQPEITSSTSL
jgi:hypothetical protein